MELAEFFQSASFRTTAILTCFFILTVLAWVYLELMLSEVRVSRDYLKSIDSGVTEIVTILKEDRERQRQWEKEEAPPPPDFKQNIYLLNPNLHTQEKGGEI